MSTQHPITPSPELIERCIEMFKLGAPMKAMREVVAQWGADQELEACIDVLGGQWEWDVLSQCTGWKEFRDQSEEILRAARRPKPPSLRKLAYDALDTYIYGEPDPKDKERTYNTIRRALEALDD